LPFLEPREAAVDHVLQRGDAPTVAMHGRRRDQVFAGREALEHPAPLERMGDGEPHPLERRQRRQILAVEMNLAARHLAARSSCSAAGSRRSRWAPTCAIA
jgi:hypothetical protein